MTSAHDFRQMNPEDLAQKIKELQAELAVAKQDVRTGKEKNHASVKELKKDVARAKTALQQSQN